MARSQITENQVLDDDFLSEDEALTLSGTLQSHIDAKPDTLLELEDTPDVYSPGLILQSTSSGVEWSTVSGASGVSDHGHLTGLDDDDHTQYIPTDGSRGFTATVSGVDPVEDEDLSTKSYVDTTISGHTSWHRIHVGAKGLLGSGGEWADEGDISGTPVIVFTQNKNTKMSMVYRVLPVFDLDYDVLIKVATTSVVGAPGTGDQVRWKLEARYVALGEAFSKAPDETLGQTQTLDDDISYQAADTRNTDIDFWLDKSLMSHGDVLSIVLTRDTDHVDDNFEEDFATSEIWLVYYGQGGNQSV